MRTHSALAVGLLVLFSAAQAAAREQDFNRGWKFHRGDPADAQQVVFDDVAWQDVRTPHDWAIAGPFDPNGDGGTGKLPWRGVGWYRKWLMLDRREEGSQVYLDFDGVMASPRVYVNGELAGEWDYGYTPFRVDITRHVRFGRANVVAVRVDTTRLYSRWYPGAGIYRQVELVVSPPLHLSRHGTQITTPTISDDEAVVVVASELENHQAKNRDAEVVVRLVGPDGAVASELAESVDVVAHDKAVVEHRFRVADPRRWDVDDPALYTAQTELRVAGHTVERRETRFGVREFAFTPDDGFWLNGRRVQIRGVNLHHDLGPLGAAFNRRAAERQLDIMQEMGVNALRTAHNPPAQEVLDLCDERGIVVWDELFDKWDGTAGRVDGEPGFDGFMQRHAASLVRRDRNHPSVVVWSVGNEIGNQPYDAEGKSRERLRTARDAFRVHDTSRPVALGCFIPQTADSDILADLDLTGWNYQRRYARFRDRFPQTPILYSETASALSTRGWYELPLPNSKCDYPSVPQVNAYEFSSAPWSDLAEVEFEQLRKDSYLAGEFVWTGFDYLGEPTPFPSQARSSYFGIVDLVGLPKDRYYLYRSHWRPDVPTVHLAPHWNWSGLEGVGVPVTLYTNGDSAELFLNGRSLGVRNKGERPAALEDLAASASATASTHADGRPAANALAAGQGRGWRPEPDDPSPVFEVDLREMCPLRTIVLEFPKESKLYGLRVEASDDGEAWETLFAKRASLEPRWGGVNELIVRTDATAQRLRVVFGPCLEGASPALDRFAAYADDFESEYFLPTYDYRLRWNEVPYEPGELRAVAYKDGQEIGSTSVRTAGPPARLALTPDRAEIVSDGEDVSFITVSAVDADGNVCPLADNALALSLVGPGKIAGADAGDPLSVDPLQDNRVSLFHGQAVIVVRADEGLGGNLSLRVSTPGLPEASVLLSAGRPAE